MQVKHAHSLLFLHNSHNSSVGIATARTARSSSPGRGKNYLYSTATRPALGPTHPRYPMDTAGSLSGSKAAGA
jgi:hypothetical protein